MANPAKDARDNAQAKWPGATVYARARKSITHQHPTDPDRFMLDAAIGPLHYGVSEDQEIDTAWQPGTAPWDYEMVKAGYNAFALSDFSFGQIVKYVHVESGEDVTFEPMDLAYSNDLDDEQIIASPQSVAAVVQNEDELFWTGAYGPGFDLRWQTQTARLDKRLIIDQASRFPAVQQYITDGGNPVLRFQFIFQHSGGISLFVNGAEWDEKPNNPVETSGYVEFRDVADSVLWSFNLPRTFISDAEDLESSQILGVFRFRKTGPNLIVEHRIPLSEILSATYPVEIDATIDDQVGASADDANELTDGSITLTALYGLVGNLGTVRHFGGRFASISGLSGATINASSYLSFYSDANDSADFVADCYAHDAESPGTFTTTTNNITDTGQRPRTTATTEADGVDFGNYSQNTWYNFTGNGTNTISDIIQELANDYDPSAIAFLFIYDSGAGERRWYSYDRDTSLAAKLHIDYTTGAAAIPNKIYEVEQAINRAGTY
jgi:hypothetical protein